jgi:photosystem II stability/assembly factor-like uncharacterized protein
MLAFFFAGFTPQFILHAQNFDWKNIEIGHGGHCDMLIPHPQENGLLYARSDVNGAYKMTNATGKWEDLLSQYFSSNSHVGRGGVAMAVDPNNKNTLYIARHALHRSTDGGVTWQNVLNKDAGNKREHGEAIAVDPQNAARVYYGTMAEGLWMSSDAGQTWSQVPPSSIPFGDGNPGVTLVAVDGSSTAGSFSKNVYVDVFEQGFFWSSNAGATWTRLTQIPTGIARVAISPSGIAYIVRVAGGVYRFDPSSATVTNITPTGAANFSATAVAVRSGTEQVVIALHSNGRRLYRATNPTLPSSWTHLPHESMVNHQPWALMQFWSQLRAWFLSSDPHNSSRVYFGDSFAFWESDDVWTKGTVASEPIVWESLPWGFENTVSLDLHTPPTGTEVKLFAGMRDVTGFRVTDPDSFPLETLARPSDDAVGLAIFEGNANHIAFIAPEKTAPFGHALYYSVNNGLNWTKRGIAFPSATFWKTTGKLAMSATDSNRLVAVAHNRLPRYSTDGGWTWADSTGLPPSTPLRWPGMDWTSYPLDNDKVLGSTFYLHYYNQPGFFRSTDGGASWAKINETLPVSGSSTLMVENSVRAVPGRAGEVWVALRSNGLWRSTNGGVNFTQIPGFQDARLLAFGAAAPDSTDPTCYVHGRRNGELSVYMSKDNGQTWTSILKPSDPRLGQTLGMAASRTEFGKVYVGTRGLGLFQGIADLPVNVPQPFNPGFELGKTGWGTSGANPVASFVEQGGAYAGSRRLVHWSTGAFQVNTYQSVTGIPDGNYSVRVWTKSSGWGTQRVYVNQYGGPQRFVSIPRNTTAWTQVQIDNLQVTQGQLMITFYTNEASGSWTYYDEVSIVPTP